MSVSLNLRTATINQLLQCLPLILNSETSEIIKLRDQNSFFGPADLSRVTGRSESEWISVPGQSNSPKRSVISVGSILFQESPQQSEARLRLQIQIPAQEPMVGATNFYAGPRYHVYSRSQFFPETEQSDLCYPYLNKCPVLINNSHLQSVRYSNQ